MSRGESTCVGRSGKKKKKEKRWQLKVVSRLLRSMVTTYVAKVWATSLVCQPARNRHPKAPRRAFSLRCCREDGAHRAVWLVRTG
jgi:hypothetical protein